MKFGTFMNCFNTDWDKLSAWIETLENGRWHSAWWPTANAWTRRSLQLLIRAYLRRLSATDKLLCQTFCLRILCQDTFEI